MHFVSKRENVHVDIQSGTVRDSHLTLSHLLSNMLEVFA